MPQSRPPLRAHRARQGLSSPGREPVLKKLVLGWLTQRSEVLAFCQARPSKAAPARSWCCSPRRNNRA
jgi:DNA-nicking Smr family endonuclease